MLKIDVKMTLNGKIAKNGENRKKITTFVPDNRRWLIVYGLWFIVYGLWFIVYGLWFIVYRCYDRYLGLSRQNGGLLHSGLQTELLGDVDFWKDSPGDGRENGSERRAGRHLSDQHLFGD